MEGLLRLQKQMSSPLARVWREDAAWLYTEVWAHLVVLLCLLICLSSPHVSPGISLAAAALCAGIFWGIPGILLYYSKTLHLTMLSFCK